MQPLADMLVGRYVAFLPKQTYPIRTRRPSEHGVRAGVRPRLCPGGESQAAARTDRGAQPERISARTRTMPAAWEPDGADFFSPSLMEADLMRRVLPAAEFRAWFSRFLPGLAKGEPKTLAAAGDRDRPHRPADRPPGRPEPEPGLVHAEHRRRAAGGRPGPEGAGGRRPRATPRRPCSTSPAATMPASTGWRRSPCTCLSTPSPEN